MRRIHIHIDRLTLEGKTRAESRGIVEAMERHLTALANGARPGRGEAGVIAHGAAPDAIGGHIATQVFQKMGGAENV